MALDPRAPGRSNPADRLLFDLLPAPAYVFDTAGLRFRAANKAALDRYGYSRGEFLKLTLPDIQPAGKRGVSRVLRELMDAAQHRAAVPHLTSGGEIFHVEIQGHPMVYKGRPSYYTVVTELLERQPVQQALHESRGRLQALFDNALDGILFVNDDARFVGANPAACALLGWNAEDILRQHIWSLAPHGDDHEMRQLWRQFRGAGRLAGEYTLQTARGSKRDVEFTAVATVLPNLHLAILRDVTARNHAQREAEQRLLELNRRLRRMSARFDTRREEDQTRFSRELHDQLGQALAGFKIDLCWLRDRIGADAVVSADLSQKIDDMNLLVDDTIARVRRLSSELRPPILDRLGLVEALEWQLDEFQRRTGILTQLRSRLEHVSVDPRRKTTVFRIFQEALANVAAHARATTVAVTLTVRRGHLELVVSDNGCGIALGAIESGDSLGIIGMRERAQLIRGTVVVQPGRTTGTTVTVTVPLQHRRSARKRAL